MNQKTLPLPFYDNHPQEKSGALFSECGNHRFVLWRSWNVSLPMAMCIGLNPSTANHKENDPTIRRLCGNKGLLNNNGFGGLYMLNRFTFVTPYPSELKELHETSPKLLEEYGALSAAVIFCWGNFKQAENTSYYCEYFFPDAFCFGKNANGSPKHPLYLPANTKLIKY